MQKSKTTIKIKRKKYIFKTETSLLYAEYE